MTDMAIASDIREGGMCMRGVCGVLVVGQRAGSARVFVILTRVADAGVLSVVLWFCVA